MNQEGSAQLLMEQNWSLGGRVDLCPSRPDTLSKVLSFMAVLVLEKMVNLDRF